MTQELTNSENRVIVSVQSLLDIRKTAPKYRDVDAASRQKWILEKIAWCNTINHTRQNPETLKIDAAALDAAMMNDRQMGDLTAPEITFAMLHGTMGEYGEYYGLTPRAFVGFFREFMKTDIKSWATFQENKKPVADRGSWELYKIKLHEEQVRKEFEEREEQAETDKALEGWKKNIEQTLKSNTQ